MRSEAGNARPLCIQQAAASMDSAKIQVFGLVKHFAFKTFLQQTDFEGVIGLDKCFAFHQIMREMYFMLVEIKPL
jgi:hypothetical protein